jgi:hypothetical protein
LFDIINNCREIIYDWFFLRQFSLAHGFDDGEGFNRMPFPRKLVRLLHTFLDCIAQPTMRTDCLTMSTSPSKDLPRARKSSMIKTGLPDLEIF